MIEPARQRAPIGVFDSGIGGLTVAKAIYDRLPGESTIYFGDTARVPYGPKSPETVRRPAPEASAGFPGYSRRTVSGDWGRRALARVSHEVNGGFAGQPVVNRFGDGEPADARVEHADGRPLAGRLDHGDAPVGEPTPRPPWGTRSSLSSAGKSTGWRQ